MLQTITFPDPAIFTVLEGTYRPKWKVIDPLECLRQGAFQFYDIEYTKILGTFVARFCRQYSRLIDPCGINLVH